MHVKADVHWFNLSVKVKCSIWIIKYIFHQQHNKIYWVFYDLIPFLYYYLYQTHIFTVICIQWLLFAIVLSAFNQICYYSGGSYKCCFDFQVLDILEYLLTLEDKHRQCKQKQINVYKSGQDNQWKDLVVDVYRYSIMYQIITKLNYFKMKYEIENICRKSPTVEW